MHVYVTVGKYNQEHPAHVQGYILYYTCISRQTTRGPFLLAVLALESLACHRLVYRILLYCVASGKPYGSSMGIGQMLSTSNTTKE